MGIMPLMLERVEVVKTITSVSQQKKDKDRLPQFRITVLLTLNELRKLDLKLTCPLYLSYAVVRDGDREIPVIILAPEPLQEKQPSLS